MFSSGGCRRTTLAATLALQLLGALLVGILIGADKNVLPVDIGPAWSYRLVGSNLTDRDNAWKAMVDDETNTYWEKNLPNQAERSVSFAGEEVEVIYHGSCITRENLASMKSFEDGLIDKGSSLCNLEPFTVREQNVSNSTDLLTNSTTGTSTTPSPLSDPPCRKTMSILRFFDGTYEDAIDFTGKLARDSPPVSNPNGLGLPTFRPDPNYDRLNNIIMKAFENDGTTPGSTDLKSILQYTLGIDDYNLYDITKSQYCRSKMYTGAPLNNFWNMEDRLTEQRKKMRELQVDHIKSYLEDHNKVGSLDVVYSSAGLREEAYDNERLFSYLLLIGSAIVVVVGVMVLTRSPFLAIMLILTQLGTFFWSAIVYRYMFVHEWLGLPIQLSPFLIVLGSLCNFLRFFHEWKEGAGEPDVAIRLSRAYRGANLTVIISTLLALLAYWMHCFSSVVVIRSTALFFGITVLVNLLTHLCFSPSLILLWHKHLGYGRAKPTGTKKVENGQISNEEVPQDRISNTIFNYTVGHRTTRWFITAGMIILIAIFVIVIVRLTERSKEQPKTWIGKNNYAVFDTWSRERFGHSESGNQASVHIVWGLDNLDTSSCHESDRTCYGDPVYNNLFDLSSMTAQEKLIEFCDNLESLDGGIVNKLKIQRKMTGPHITGRPDERPTEIKCFIAAQRDYYTANHASGPYEKTNGDGSTTVVNTNVTMPSTYEKMAALMKGNTRFYPPAPYKSCAFFPPLANSIYEESCNFCDSYYRHYEIYALNWVANGGDIGLNTEDLETFVGLFGGSADATLDRSQAGVLRYAGNYGSFVRYAAIEVNLTIDSNKADYLDALEVLDDWDDYVADNIAAMPLPLKMAFQTTPRSRTWAWMRIQKNLLSDMFQGLLVSVCLYAMFVTLYLNNIPVSILLLIQVISTPVIVVGVYTSCGWDMGYVESVNMIIPVSIASEIITPFAVWYARGSLQFRDDRQERSRESFTKSALSIFGSSTMVFTAALFLLGSPVTYFFHFAVTLLSAIAASLLLAMFLLVTLLNIAGPEGKQGEFMSCAVAGNPLKVAPDSGAAQATSTAESGAFASPSLSAGGTVADDDSDSDDDFAAPSRGATRNVVAPPGGARQRPVPPPPAGQRPVPPAPTGAQRAPVPPPPGRMPGAQVKELSAPPKQGPLPPMPPSPAAAPAPATVPAQAPKPYGSIPEVDIHSAATTPANSASRHGREQQSLD